MLFAIAVSAGCVRLGFWQLQRLSDRRTLNASLAAGLGATPKPVRDLLRDTTAASFRRATATGVYDFANEFALAGRTRQGSPGVHVITPLRMPESDTALLVNRGWVYAPDAMTARLERWKEPDTATVSGYLVEIRRGGRGAVASPTSARVVRRLDRDSLTGRLPYPVAPFALVVTDTAYNSRDSVPARGLAPLLDEGPHLGYAIQWFGFAFIGLLGAGFSVRADRRARRPS